MAVRNAGYEYNEEKTLGSATKWLRDNSLADLDNLPDTDVLAAEIIGNLEAGLESFRDIMVALNKPTK